MGAVRTQWRAAIRLVLGIVVAVSGAWTDAASFSGNPGAPGAQARFTPEQVIALAKQVERTLAGKGARVAIIARMGRPRAEMPEGMHFTHAAFAVYSQIATRDGRTLHGYAIYNEYQNDDRPDTSSLVQDYPADFFASVAELEAGILIPSAELQARLLATIGSPTYQTLHEPRYSAIANPYTEGRQNCTEFVLDVINAAIYETADIRRIKAATRQYFVAQDVNVSPLKLLLGGLFSAEVSLSDHPGTPVTATFETIGAYLLKYDQGSEMLLIHPDSFP